MEEAKNSTPVQATPVAKKDNTTLIIVAVVVGVVLLCCCIGAAVFFLSGNSVDDGRDGVVGTKEYSLNEAAKVGDVTWTITTAVNEGDTLYASDSEYDYMDDEVTSGSWIRVRGTVTNNGNETVYLDSPVLVDSQDREYSSASTVYSWIPDGEEVIYEEIQPGMSYTFTEYFEVGSGVTGLRLKIDNLEIFDEKIAYVDINL